MYYLRMEFWELVIIIVDPIIFVADKVRVYASQRMMVLARKELVKIVGE